jgi:hypothetical protein
LISDERKTKRMPLKEIRSLLVYCGANVGGSPVYRQSAQALGKMMAEEKIRLVYGGGSIGLMGILADSVLENGGEVTGVIPGFLDAKEIGHKGVRDMRVVSSMHERKALMEQLCDAAIALPGGFGTMDEIFEMLTWAQLGLHRKPLGLLNVNGYYDLFVAMMDKMVEEQFLKPLNRNLLLVAPDEKEMLRMLREADPKVEEKWINREGI